MGDDKSLVKIENLDLSNLTIGQGKLLSSFGKFCGYPISRAIREQVAVDAQVQSAITMARGVEELSAIEQRMERANREQDLWRHENKEKILAMAFQEMPAEASEEPVDEDWKHQAIEHSQDVGNKDMQSLWAKLLAGEVAKPGSFSLRTLAVVKTLSRQDAELFTTLCSFAWLKWDNKYDPILLDTELWPDKRNVNSGIYLDRMLDLEWAGLVSYSPGTAFGMEIRSASATMKYFERTYRFQPSDNNKFPIGHVLFTQAGRELVSIAGAKKNEEYEVAAIELLKSQGFTVTEVEDES